MSITKQLLKDAKSNIIFAMLASMVSASAGIAIIAGINYVIEQGITNLPSAIGLYIALLALLLASSVWSQVLLVNIGYSMVFKLRKNLVNRILNTSIERQEQLGSTDIYNVLTRDVTMVSNATRQLPVAMYNSFLVLAGLLYLLWLSPLLFLFVCVVVVFGVWTDAKLTNSLQHMLTKVRRLDDTLFQHYEAVVEGRNELALNQKRRHVLFDEQFLPTAEESRAQAAKAEVVWAVNLNWTTLLIFFIIGVVFFAGLKIESVGQDVVIAYILAIMFLRTPLSMILDSIPTVIKGNVALQAINRLDLNEDDSAADTKQSTSIDFNTLQLKQVQYQYPTHNGEAGFTLGPIDFEVHKGELIFLIGGNGSGKSTLAKLLTGLYKESSGQLLLNGTQINDSNRSQLRNCFSAIFPSFYLFSDVVDTHGSSQDDEKITHYLERLAINSKVSVQQGKLSTTALSQGQRKRLALVLLYMENRQVLLLDEWAADQDPVFREVFYREILPQLQRDGKTVIAISHDDHYFDVADRIYKLDYGQLIQFDVHQHKLFSAG
ncbi:ABC transporter ATP-binding/permease protein YojI [Pseudoalteromonas holothuriae]|uniref:ABC transporter ATP-binding/permease protein YojI n=1 Tax=Pseudoalteromonas holothuriae TaxID=2963714 RepID=A0ABN8URE3_9GAMM|nr:cyclic peptide export ABC transporter [Pseudoalteromonas sp. CIP111951]CAH9067886.1 ABC transporter ATP-binding/permease protein YojI [Pseudoalteromonas sp. CIP111951]